MRPGRKVDRCLPTLKVFVRVSRGACAAKPSKQSWLAKIAILNSWRKGRVSVELLGYIKPLYAELAGEKKPGK